MRDKPQGCYDSLCPLAITCRHCGHPLSAHVEVDGKEPCRQDGCKCGDFASQGRGFVLGSGDPKTAGYAAILEAPGSSEISFLLRPVKGRDFLGTQEEINHELEIRRRDYPTIPEKFLRVAAPAVGRTGAMLEYWVWPKVGLARKDFYVDNTLRCLPPATKSGGAYPAYDIKKAAEKACRQWDRVGAFRPDTLVFTLHPAGIMREITPLPLLVRDFERVRDFVKAGRRVVALLGGKAAKAFARFGSNITKWRGHYVLLPPNWDIEYKARFDYKAKEKKKKEPKEPKEKQVKAKKAKVPKEPKPKRAKGTGRTSRKKRMAEHDGVFDL